MNPISLLVVTYNEEHRIGPFFERVLPHVAQLAWIDQSSTDDTVSIGMKTSAGYMRDVAFKTHECRGFSEASNPDALSMCTQPWVLSLFPDEVLTAEVVRALPILCADERFDAYIFFRDTYEDGRPRIMHEQTMRLVRRGKIVVSTRIHTDPSCSTFRNRIRMVHDYVGIEHRKSAAEIHADNVRYMALANGEGVL